MSCYANDSVGVFLKQEVLARLKKSSQNASFVALMCIYTHRPQGSHWPYRNLSGEGVFTDSRHIYRSSVTNFGHFLCPLCKICQPQYSAQWIEDIIYSDIPIKFKACPDFSKFHLDLTIYVCKGK